MEMPTLNIAQSLVELCILVVAFLVSITIHEFSHALAAYLLGDPTAQQAGRLTLNPLAHLDPLGFLFLILFRIGWAKPVPMNSQNFHYPRLFAVLAALAGPFSNFLLACSALYILHYFPFTLITQATALYAQEFFNLLVWINVMLGIFNIIPLPPLDGSHILFALTPPRFHPYLYACARYAIFIVLFVFLLPAVQRIFIAAINSTVNFLKILVV